MFFAFFSLHVFERFVNIGIEVSGIPEAIGFPPYSLDHIAPPHCQLHPGFHSLIQLGICKAELLKQQVADREASSAARSRSEDPSS